ncbi:3-oxoacyl-ACP reductase FabG [Paraconexibacter antarcticus]|uniref:3-oxoacyl-ACP reductase FabG n=1 Tax=Paraconexibacter antarcticus TaxID=2949664 RepID=A0ABY5DMT4_9ACTN|nr:3-oxoacyl-ACP reductase family protein [Paraconexibacter antarcticus]UTI63305.1 3-oxoacyl-ACP reductase FabG [Paraconexibacter antarcticus]
MSERVALVTGGARGIGRAIAQALAADDRAVAVADLLEDGAAETVKLIEADGGRAVAVSLDVTSAASVATAFARVTAELGPVDVLVNCAGWDVLMPFVETDEEFWQKVIEINYKGVLRTTHAALPGMMERGFGRIVNIGSDAGRVGSSLEAVYAGTKGGVIAFTKTIAREAARKGVTANTVCPGPTDTPLLGAIVDAAEDADKVIGAMTRAVPMKRLGQPEEVAAAVAFLAGESAGFISGQTLSVSGGLTMA